MLLIYLAPLAFVLAGITLLMSTPNRTSPMLRVGEWASFVAMGTALAAIVTLITEGASTSALIGANGAGLSARLDIVAIAMLTLVSFIGWVVTRFAIRYTDGEGGQAGFLGTLALTLAAVLLFVTSGNVMQLIVGWIGTCVGLRSLLLFYGTRRAAQRAARKKTVVDIASTIALIAASFILATNAGTGDIATILATVAPGTSTIIAAGLLALFAVLASAMIPLHGWLTEVMEAPTPVSALLHAGVVNAGGVVLIRFADVMITAPGVLSVLVMLGGMSALIGGLVMLTQPAIKTALAWSTVAQMGFMLLQAGFALFPLALLHIVAHSLYKAHAFLSSGGAVASVASIKRPGPVAVPNLKAVSRAFVIALAIYATVAVFFGIGEKSIQAIALGAILVFGVAYMLAQGLADAAPMKLTVYTALISLAVTLGYFSLQLAATALTAGALPTPPAPGALEWVLMAVAVLSFGAVALAQACFPLWAKHPATEGLRVHLMNGLYLNAIFDRALGGWKVKEQ